MSEMTYLEKLLDGIEVEWATLGNVALFRRGTAITKKQTTRGNIPVVANGPLPTYFHGEKNREGETIVIARSGAYSGYVSYWEQPFFLTDAFSVHPDSSILIPKYVYYFLKSKQEQIHGMKKGAGVPHVRVKECELMEIPVPAKEIQAEIVRILDTFSELTTELTTELTARKKQYNYYSEQLLSFEEDGMELMPLSEIYDFQYGKGNTIPTTGGEYPVYGSNGVVGSHSEYNSEDSPVIGHIGAYAGIVNWGKGKHFVTYNGVICRMKSKDVLSQYAYYLLLLQDFGSKAKSSSHPFVSYSTLKEPMVPVPSLDEQTRIVAILDKFDTLTNSISEGLPREIEQRQKQYEYYRDLLLSFPKVENQMEENS